MSGELVVSLIAAVICMTAAAADIQRRHLSQFSGCYRKEGSIGSGSQARVYRAQPCTGDHQVVVKALPLHDKIANAEIEFLKNFTSQPYCGVPRLFDLVETKRHVNVVMQYFKGEPIQTLAIDDSQSLPLSFQEERIMRVLFKVLAIINHVHNRQFLHLDLNPQNILYDDNSLNLMIVGFRGAKMNVLTDQRSLNRLDSQYKWIPEYVARDFRIPERWGYASDIYALGRSAVQLMGRLSWEDWRLPRLSRFIKMTTFLSPGVPTAADLLRDPVFAPERAFFCPIKECDVTSFEYLTQLVALNGENYVLWDRMTLPPKNSHRHLHPFVESVAQCFKDPVCQ